MAEDESTKEQDTGSPQQNSDNVVEATSGTIVVIEDKSKQQEENNKIAIESNANITKSAGKIELDNPSGFGNDFNWEMQEENQKLKEENQAIVEKLKKKERDTQHLEEALTTLHEELKFLESQEVQSVAKDLAKKNRKLSVQLERERTRSAQLHIELQKLKSELETFSHHHLSPKKVVQPMSFSKRPDLICIQSENDNKDKDKDKEKGKNENHEIIIKQLTQKLMRSKDEISKHKDIIKKLNIALKKEIGHDIDINDIIRDGGTWKGRSEKIAILQSKLNDLNNNIKKNESNQIIRNKNNKNDQHKHNISQMASQRMKQYENAQIQIEKLVEFNNELREVLKAKNCRIKGIENNTISMRKKLQFFVQKSKNDDTLVETLQSQLNQQSKLQNTLNKKQKLLNKNNNEMNNLQSINNKQINKIEILNKIINEMKEKILNLTQQRNDNFRQMFEKFDNDDKLYQIQILKTENEKQKDIILTYKKNLVNLQKRLSRKSSPKIKDSTIIHTNRSISTKHSKIAQLKEKMDAMTQEQQLIKASYLSIIEGKAAEIEICRQLNKQQKNNYQNCVKELTQQINKMKSQILDS